MGPFRRSPISHGATTRVIIARFVDPRKPLVRYHNVEKGTQIAADQANNLNESASSASSAYQLKDFDRALAIGG